MPNTFYALDNEFAVSTGSNVNSSYGRSDFDYPPQSSKDLVITANAGDTQPGRFDVGETYDVSFSGNGSDGGMVLADAVVIRSDYAPGGNGGVVVFEGTDSGGSTVQVVWTPDFDLQSWYFDNFNNGQPPEFYTSDQQTATFEFVCFAPGTLIGTPDGPRPAGALQPGDLVDTLDHGPQPLLWVGSRELAFPPSPEQQKPVRIARDAFGPGLPQNDLVISPQHRLLATAPPDIAGGGEVLVRAKSMLPARGVRVMRGKRRVTYVTLLFDRHEIIFAEGLAAESFYPGPYAMSVLSPIQRAQIIARLPGILDDVEMVLGPLARPEVRHRKALALTGEGALSVPRLQPALKSVASPAKACPGVVAAPSML